MSNLEQRMEKDMKALDLAYDNKYRFDVTEDNGIHIVFDKVLGRAGHIFGEDKYFI